MRISSGLMMDRYLRQINNSYAEQAKLMEQSDGSNLHRPSDDSVKYSRYLRYQNSNTENLQYQDNVNAGISWMKTADSAMVNMTDIYTTLKEKTVDAANDTNGESDLVAISKEFKAKLYEIVSLGNTQQGDRYVFSGQSDLTQPFLVSVEEKDRGLAKTLDDPQSAFFLNPTDTKNLNADDTGSLTQMLTLQKDGQDYYLNTMNGKIYTKEFVQEGYKDKVAHGQTHVAEGDEVATIPFFSTDALKVAGYFENTGVIRTESEVTITDSSGNTTKKTIEFGESIGLAAGETAVADTTVWIKNSSTGDIRAVAPGNTIEIDPDEEMTTVGVPLEATTYLSGKAVSISSTSTLATSTTYSAGTQVADLGYYQAMADADVEVENTSSGTTRTVKAGELIVLSANEVVNILADGTNLVRDPSETAAYNAGDTISVSSSSDDDTIADQDVDIYDTNGTVVRTVTAGNPISINTSAGETAKIVADGNVTIIHHNTLSSTSYDTGAKVSMAAGETAVLPGADVMIKDAEGNARIVKAGNTISLDTSKGETEYEILGKASGKMTFDSFATIKQPIVSYQGDAKYISMVKLNGTVDQTADTVNATGQDLNGSDIFDDANSGNQTTIMSNGRLCYVSSGTAMLNNMFTVCAKMEAGDNHWMTTDGITVADVSHETVVRAQSSTAARQNVYDSVAVMLDKQNEGITSDLNDVSATDVAELAVKLMAAQTIYNMSLSVGGRILPPSLADYLS